MWAALDKEILHNVEKLISTVPIIKMNSIKNNDVKILMEKFNVTGSVKVKTVYRILKRAIEQKNLTVWQTVLEASSGNTAISLAYFAQIFDLKVEIILPKSTASCKKKLISSYWANIIEIDGITDDCIAHRDEIYKSNPEKYFLPNQFTNYANFYAHHFLTWPYIYHQIQDIDVRCAGLWTSGTLLGTANFLKEKNPNIKVIAINPIQKIEWLRNFKSVHIEIPFYNKNKWLIDEIIDVDFNEAIDWVDFYLKEWYFNGISSWAIISWIKKYLKWKKWLNVVSIAPDGWDYYFESLIKYIDLKKYRGCK